MALSRFSNKKQNGFSIIEIFISVTLLVIIITGGLSLIYPALRSAEVGRERLEAKWLLWEEEEAIRQVRNESWANLSPGTYYPVYNQTSNPPTTYQGWQLLPGTWVKNGYNEYVTITIPYRTNSNQVTDTGSTADSNMRKVVSTVSWNSFGQTYSLSLTSYISNWQPF